MSSASARTKSGPIGVAATSLSEKVNQFFFAEEAPYGMAVLRMVLPLAMFIDFVSRYLWVREIYSSDGSPAPIAENYGYPGFVPIFPGPVAVGLYTAMLFLFLTAAIGWRTRLSLAVSGVLMFLFAMADCMSTQSKYHVIATHFMLLLAVSRCGDIWSVDRWLLGNDPNVTFRTLRSPVWPQRLVQILLGMIYFGASITKMHTPGFLTGDQMMYWMMSYINGNHSLGDYLTQYPILIIISGYVAITWEMIFLFMVWQKWARWPVLFVGCLFHIMTSFTLGLNMFPAVMIASYAVFFTETDVLALRRFVRGFRLLSWTTGIFRMPSLRVPNQRWLTGGYAAACVVLSLAAVQAEQWMDVYHERGPDGPLPLKEISAEEADRLLRKERPLLEADKILAVDVGSSTIGDHLVSFRKDFRHGDMVIVQVSLNPPHEDLWVDCNLHDADGLMIARSGAIVPRDSLRSHFKFKFDETVPPGECVFVVKSSGQEVARKVINVRRAIGAERADDSEAGTVEGVEESPAATPEEPAAETSEPPPQQEVIDEK